MQLEGTEANGKSRLAWFHEDLNGRRLWHKPHSGSHLQVQMKFSPSLWIRVRETLHSCPRNRRRRGDGTRFCFAEQQDGEVNLILSDSGDESATDGTTAAGTRFKFQMVNNSMQSAHSILVTLALLAAVSWGCNQPLEPARTASEGPTEQPAIRAPEVTAGADMWLPLPANSMVLQGSVTTTPSTIVSYAWKVISGPTSITLGTPASWRTIAGNLQEGTYEFEFSVSVKGAVCADIVRLHVYEPRTPGANEFIFEKVNWFCPMGCSANPGDLPFPGKDPARVLLKHANDPAWLEAVPEALWRSGGQYVYSIRDGRLSVYADSASGAADIWVIF